MRPKTLIVSILLAGAASTASAQQQPAIRQLGPVVWNTTESLTNVAGIRAVSGGGVFVNDMGSRRVLLFDSTLSTFTVVADSTSATANAYGGRFGGLLPFKGDSTLFVDPVSMSMLVMDRMGKVARVMSVPSSQDAMAFAGGPFGGASFDPAGRLVYRAGNRFRFRGPPPTSGTANGGVPTIPQQPDSAAILRVDLGTRAIDTVGYIKTPKMNMQMTRSDDGTVTMVSEVNPLPIVDDWGVLPDGSIAIVRGRDYHVDWIAPDGSKRSSPKLPFEWQRLSDEDKIALIDSVKAMRERMAASGSAGERGAAAPGAMGGAQEMIVMRQAPGGAGGAPPMRDGTRAPPQVNFVPPDQLPDYKPPFFAGAVRADADGNLWIRTIPTKAIAGGPIYDVVNAKGELVERVQIPAGRNIVGFGAGGAVYMVAREGDRTVLERARAR